MPAPSTPRPSMIDLSIGRPGGRSPFSFSAGFPSEECPASRASQSISSQARELSSIQATQTQIQSVFDQQMGSGLQASVPSTSGQNTLGSCRPGMRLDQHTPAGLSDRAQRLDEKGFARTPRNRNPLFVSQKKAYRGSVFQPQKNSRPNANTFPLRVATHTP